MTDISEIQLHKTIKIASFSETKTFLLLSFLPGEQTSTYLPSAVVTATKHLKLLKSVSASGSEFHTGNTVN